jgi:hypothetical protein
MPSLQQMNCFCSFTRSLELSRHEESEAARWARGMIVGNGVVGTFDDNQFLILLSLQVCRTWCGV